MMLEGTTHEFSFSLAAFRLSAIKKAMYRYSGNYYVELKQNSPEDAVVVLTSHPRLHSAELPAEGFPGEVLDQELRETVAEETETVRNIILAQAFGSVDLIKPIGEINLDPNSTTES